MAITSLKSDVAHGVKWSTISQAGRLGTQLLTTVILARLLSPADFGLVGMAMVIIGFIGIFKDLGTSAAVIQRKELSQDLLSSIFWVNVGLGILAAVTLLLISPLGGWYYDDPRVVAVLQTLSPSFLISGLGILHQTLMERSLSFAALARVEIISVVFGSIIGVGSALAGAGTWSLVFQFLTTVSMTTVLLWLSNSWRPRWSFHWKEVRSVSHFSLNLTGFGIFNYFIRNVDYLLIGRYLGAQELGYYTMAYRILLFPVQNISAVIGRVLFPAFAAIQNDNNRIAAAYLKVIRVISLISFPLMLGVLVLAEPFVFTFLGEKWQPVVQLIAILAPVGLFQSIGATVSPIYQVKGRTDWMFRWGVGAGLLVIAAFVIGLRWGITGVAWGYAIASFILLYPNFSIPFRLIDLKFVQMLKVLKPALLNGCLMVVILIIVRFALPSWFSDIWVLFVSVAIGGITYLLANWLTNRSQFLELWELAGFGRHIPPEQDNQ